MRLCRVIMLVFSIFYLSGSLSPALGVGDPAYARVESCQYTECITTDCGWIPGWRSYCVWTMDLGYYDCTGERIHGGLDSFRRAPENYPDHLWECIGCEESGPYYVYRPECHPKGWYYLSSNTLFGDWDCHRGGVLDLRTPEMIEAGCDPYIAAQRPELNLGWGDDPALYCPTKAGTGSVNVATGNHIEKVVDLSLSGPGIPLEFVRFYNSQATNDGPLGYGWTHNYNLFVTWEGDQPGDEVLVWDADGRALSFVREEAGTLRRRFGVKGRLEQDASGYRLTQKSTMRQYIFDQDGRLIRIQDLNGNFLDLVYQGPELREVTSSFGKRLVFHYTGGRIDRLTDPKNQEILYGYQTDNLSSVSYPDTTRTTYSYDDPNDPHNLTSQLDTEKRIVGQWSYDEGDKTIVAEGADRMDLDYGFLNTKVTDSLGHTKTFHTQIKEHIYLVAQIEGEGCSSCGQNQEFSYDHGLNLVQTVDGRGTVTLYEWVDEMEHASYTYDENNNPTIRIEAFGTAQQRKTLYSYTYDETTPLLVRERVETKDSVVSPAEQKTTVWRYDEAGNPLSKQETGYALVDGGPTLQTFTTEYGYNSSGQLTWVDGPRTDVSDITTFAYYENSPSDGNNRGQLKAIVNALGHRTEFSDYDANANVGRITDPNGVVMDYTYDERNRIKTVTNQTAGAITQYFYDGHGNIDYIILPEGNQIDYTHDPADRLTDIEDSVGNTIHYEYDTEGNRIREEIRDPEGIVRKYLDLTYDPRNRLQRIINPDKTFTEYTYDENGNRTSFTDENGRVITYEYDALNRLMRVIQHLDQEDVITGYTYDSHDNLINIIDSEDHRTTYGFDDFGRLSSTTSPDTGTTLYRYDEAGNLISRTDAKGVTLTYIYDSLNRLRAIDFPEDPGIIYTYDEGETAKGRLTGMSDKSGSYAYTYDALGNLVREEKTIKGVTYITAYRYDRAGLLRGLTYPSGRTIDYESDGARRVSRVSTTKDQVIKPLAEDLTYLPFGQLRGLRHGNGITLGQDFDSRYRLKRLQAPNVLDLAYDYDGVGNIQTLTDTLDPPRSQTFGYDDLNRLTRAQGLYGTIGYTYDRVGNRLTKAAGEETDTYLYSPGTNRLSGISGAHWVSFGYDANGNTVSENNRGYLYNQNNRLARVSENGSRIAEYTYNGAGQRIEKTTFGQTRISHYDLFGRLIAETGQEGETQVEYVYLGDLPLVMIRGKEEEPVPCFLSQASQGGSDQVVYYFYNDHLGTPQILTDEQGTVVWKAEYQPFGQVEIVIEEVENNLRFPGQYFDNETGLHYNYFRDYHPEIGRYLEPDPLKDLLILSRYFNPRRPLESDGRFKFYAYALNNPLNRIDPLGLADVAMTWDPSLVDEGFRLLREFEFEGCHSDYLCSTTYWECMDKCVSYLNRWWIVPLDAAVGVGGAIATGSVQTGFSWAGAGLTGWFLGTSVGCSLQCAEDQCSYDF